MKIILPVKWYNKKYYTLNILYIFVRLMWYLQTLIIDVDRCFYTQVTILN